MWVNNPKSVLIKFRRYYDVICLGCCYFELPLLLNLLWSSLTTYLEVIGQLLIKSSSDIGDKHLVVVYLRVE